MILDKAKVAIVPGEAFGAPGYARLSFALGDDDLVEGIGRIADLLAAGGLRACHLPYGSWPSPITADLARQQAPSPSGRSRPATTIWWSSCARTRAAGWRSSGCAGPDGR